MRFHFTFDDGVVSKAEPSTSNPARLRIVETLRSRTFAVWLFYEGPDVFDVEFTYELLSREAVVPENPRIEMKLPRSVKLTGVPVTPTLNYQRQNKTSVNE